MILDKKEVKDKESVVTYLQRLIESELELPYYNLHRLLVLNNININSIIFQESKKSNLSVLNISDLKNDSVDLIISEKSWIEYLPEIYKNNNELKNFLYGIQVSMFKQRFLVDNIEDIFIPRKSEFLDWLASWYGVGFSSSVKSDTKRELIYKLLKLYKKRGTVEYLLEMVKILTGANIQIKERTIPSYLQQDDEFIGEEYNLNITFTVKILDTFENQEEEKNLIKKIENILEREKPAFTEYYIDSDVIKEEIKVVGIDRIVKDEIQEEEVDVEHHQHEKEQEKDKKEDNELDDNQDDFFLFD